MQKTVSATPLDAVKIEQRPDGQADVWLRKNITKETIEDETSGEQREQWVADEVHLVKAITQEEAEASFDELWDEAEASETPQDERIKALETIAKTLNDVEPQLSQIRTAAKLAVQTISSSLTDEQAMSIPSLVKEWAPGMDVSEGEVLYYDGMLYRVDKAHTTKDGWEPNTGSGNRFHAINMASDGVEVWIQPKNANSAYANGVMVHYPDASGPVYESLVDKNMKSPDKRPEDWKQIQ